jgi:YidC/Oxa1 family membrane protein insertase
VVIVYFDAILGVVLDTIRFRKKTKNNGIMSDTARLFTALILSMGTIFAWNYFYAGPKYEKEKVVQEQIQKNSVIPAKAGIQPQQNPVETLKAELSAVKTVLTREDALKTTTRVKINTKKLHGSINLIGGMIDDITLANYRQELDKKSPEVILLSPRRTEKQYFLNTGWLLNSPSPSTGEGRGEGELTPNDNSLWNLESGKQLTPATPVVISFNNGQGLTFRKSFSIDENYLITVKQSVTNRTGNVISLANFGVINRAYDMKTPQVYVSHEGPIAVADKKLKDATYKALQDDKQEEYKGVTGWVAMADKYWLTSIIPQNSATEKSDITFKYYQKEGVDRFQSDILSAGFTVAPNSSAEYTYNIYAGAKQLKLIEEYKDKLKIDLFDRAIDFGSLYILTKPMAIALTYFHSLVGNMGLAIMLLTICVRLILFPLANKSYSSMARMKKHMPEIMKLKEIHKNDKQKQGTEMMKYYRSHKINPAAGCLPILVQIPVFFSLYKVLYVTLETRHEPFFWFIHDLSAQDPTNIFTLFGLVVWNVPSILPQIGILPILFSCTMVLQQKLNPPMTDETQRIIMAWMPWIFLFVFANFASGLVVYWIWNNMLSILQQYIITRKVEEDKNE